jgi:hypothetical protein
MGQDHQEDTNSFGQIDKLYSLFFFSRHDACKISIFSTKCKRKDVSLC